jgi:hypothetical protein
MLTSEKLFTAVTMKDVFLNMTPCGYGKNRRFGGTYRRGDFPPKHRDFLLELRRQHPQLWLSRLRPLLLIILEHSG